MSYGLDFILGGLSSLSGGFVTWFTITPSSEIQKAFVDKELKTNPEEEDHKALVNLARLLFVDTPLDLIHATRQFKRLFD